MTKLCTCRSASERPACVYVSVRTEFVSGSPPPLAAADLLILERPRHECDERLTSKGTNRSIFSEIMGHFPDSAASG